MAKYSGGRSRGIRPGPARPSGTPVFQEPEVRRWPHPVDGSEPSSGRQPPRAPVIRQTDAALYYIHCALAYQNQLLADIKALLEQLAADCAQAQEKK